MPAPPVFAVVTVVFDDDPPVVSGGPPAAQAGVVALRASSASPAGTSRVNRKAFLFRRPAGLAVGLAPKEMRLSRIHREMSPGDIKWVPRSADVVDARGLGAAQYTDRFSGRRGDQRRRRC
jgi:hypothetical protein